MRTPRVVHTRDVFSASVPSNLNQNPSDPSGPGQPSPGGTALSTPFPSSTFSTAGLLFGSKPDWGSFDAICVPWLTHTGVKILQVVGTRDDEATIRTRVKVVDRRTNTVNYSDQYEFFLTDHSGVLIEVNWDVVEYCQTGRFIDYVFLVEFTTVDNQYGVMGPYSLYVDAPGSIGATTNGSFSRYPYSLTRSLEELA